MMGANQSMVIDVVDGCNNIVGTAPRSAVFQHGLNFRTVHVFVLDKSHRKLLLQKLPVNHKRSPARLGSSVAGYLNAGEKYRQAAKRKIKEELGIQKNLRLESLGVLNVPDENVSKFVALFVTSYDRVPDFNEDEIDAVVYFALDKLDAMVAREPQAFTKTFIYAYREFRQRGYARQD